MTRIKLIIIAMVLAMASALPAAAQFKFGLKAGMTVNSLHFDKSVFESDNRAGFTGGLMCEFTVPVIGVGLDVSAMYVRRSAEWMESNNVMRDNRDYFTIPVNLKWKFSIPVVKPYIVTGPEFAFLTSKKAISEAYHNKSVDYSWNIGAGIEILSHLQVQAQYGIGLNNALEKIGAADNATKVEAKNRVWTITAAYLF